MTNRRGPPPSRLAIPATTVLVALLACDLTVESNTAAPAVQLLVGPALPDTVQAEPVQAMIFRVAGATSSGLVVRFEPRIQNNRPFVSVSSLSGPQFAALAVDTTNARGEAAVRLKLGTFAGAAVLRVTVPELGLRDSVEITVLPGAAAAVQLQPGDTTMLRGRSFSIKGGVVDRFGNARPETVTFTATGAALDLSGRLVNGVTEGRGRVVGSQGGLSDTVSVTVVPDGVLSVVTNGVVTFRTDGADPMRISDLPIGGLSADWSPDQSSVAVDNALGSISVVRADGSVEHPTLGGAQGSGGELYPEFSSDGRWLYYSRLDADGWEIRRVHPDGSGDESIIEDGGQAVAPSVSPDGTKVAYVLTGPDILKLRDLATGTSVVLAPNGHTPAWSPAGDLIAYVATFSGQEIRVVTPGGASHTVSAPGASYQLGLDWSPDGRWLAARNVAGTLDLIEAATGLTLPLTQGATGGSALAWKH